METKILEQHKNARTLSVRDACEEIIAEKGKYYQLYTGNTANV